MSDSEEEVPVELFQEPEGFIKPFPEPTFETYHRLPENIRPNQPSEVKVRLVGKSPLWGHLLWNAGIVTAEYLDSHPEIVENRAVLELGAAAALPSLICSLTANNTVITDYPDPELIQNIECNVKHLQESVSFHLKVIVSGYIWGNDTSELLDLNGGHKYDFIILSDLIFNHTEHRKLIKCCSELLTDDGKLFVVFTPHRPKLYHKDLEFFETAKEMAGFKSTQIINKKCLEPMFEEEEETKELRSMVFGYIVERNSHQRS